MSATEIIAFCFICAVVSGLSLAWLLNEARVAGVKRGIEIERERARKGGGE